MPKLKYELCEEYETLHDGQQDPVFHMDETHMLAEGDGWACFVATRGELRARYTDPTNKDNIVCDREIFERYLTTDKQVGEAEDSDTLVFDNNPWFEIEFCAKTPDGGYEYMDLMGDDCCAYSYKEARKIFDDYINDSGWTEDFVKYLADIKAENEGEKNVK